MHVLVVGGHGQIGLRLLQRLATDGHTARGTVRSEAQAGDLEAMGARPVVLDLERAPDITDAVRGADAVVFAAGAGPGSGAARKQTVDLGGAVKLIEAARSAGARRYLMISAMGAARPPAGDDGMAPYLRAKAAADEALRASGLDYTILRPGRLTDESGTGCVALAASLGRRGSIARDDVAATLAALLGEPGTIGLTLEVLGGEEPVEAAVARVAGEA